MYGQVENSKVTKIFASKPNWLDDFGTIISEEDLIKENVFPIDTTLNREIDFDKERVIVNGINDLEIDYTNKKIINYFKIQSFSLEEVYERKVKELELTKNQKTFVNLNYTFPDNKSGVIQLRSQHDLDNINALYADATHCITNNIDKTYSFKDEANISHVMTTQQMSDLGFFVKQHVDKFFLEHWNIKHNKLDPIFNDTRSTQTDRIERILSIVWK